MDIRTVRTRAMLRDALQTLLDKKSFEEISVSEVCELSTVRRATFYRHFKDRNDFYEWYLQTITDQFLSELEHTCTLFLTRYVGLQDAPLGMHCKNGRK